MRRHSILREFLTGFLPSLLGFLVLASLSVAGLLAMIFTPYGFFGAGAFLIFGYMANFVWWLTAEAFHDLTWNWRRQR